MLHLNFGLNFVALADRLIDELKNAWTDPFAPPIVIFPDLTLEHWFKLRWMERFGTLANLNTQFLDKFLFDALNDGDHPNRVRLSSDLLRNLILSWCMQSTQEGKSHWQYLGAEPTQYLATDNELKTADEMRLFDLASQMTRLYMDYETSRPGAFKTKNGLIQTWNLDDASRVRFFTKSNEERENWQRILYNQIFTKPDAIVKRIQEKLNIELITVPQLYEICRTPTDNIQFAGASHQPVFIFWHAGMGQFYRVALHEYSKKHEVHAYVQNPCMEFWEDVQNQKLKFKYNILNDIIPVEESDEFGPSGDDNMLLIKWGRGGRDNIKLWCESVDYDFDFHHDYVKFDYDYYSDTQIDVENDSTLHKIQNLVAKRENLNGETLALDKSLTVTGAPSKIREIENLHTQICQLLKDTDDKKGANIRDILIVAPDINAYRTAIYQVFAAERTQAEENRQKKHNQKKGTQAPDNDNSDKDNTTPALYIPFNIIDGAPQESLTAHAIDVLFRIADKRSLSRLEFFELIRNPVVQNVRGIDPNEISTWETWLTKMQVFRDREILDGENIQKYEDWKTGIKRLLLARLTDCRVMDGNNVILPYADIESSDDKSLCHFIDAINDIEEWCETCKTHVHGLSLDLIDSWFIPYLNSWISMDNPPRELNAESIIYKSIAEGIETLKYQYSAGIEIISWKCIEQTVRQAAESSEYITGSLFVNGLTFMNFTPNRIIPIKHLFFLGMDAASFPGRDIPNSLDLRTSDFWPGDNQNAYKNRYAFLCQLMSTSESLHLSYVNKNLQKDEDFYPSSIINDLFAFCEGKKMSPAIVPLDEVRPVEDLFTARAFRNHDIHACMTKNDAHQIIYNDDVPCTHLSELPERVTLSKLKKYLNDPFQFRVSEVLQSDDNDMDPEKIVYEPIDIDNLELLTVVKDVAQVIVKSFDRVTELSQEQLKTEIDQRIEQEAVWQEITKIITTFIEQLRESGFRTASLYEQLIQKKIITDAKNIAYLLLLGNLTQADDDNAIDLCLIEEIEGIGTKRWQLQGKAEWHFWRDHNLSITSVVLNDGAECSKFLRAFISALALVLKKGHKEKVFDQPYSVALFLCGTKAKSVATKQFEITAEEAENLLQRMYQYAYVERFSKVAPMKLLVDKLKSSSTKTKSNDAETDILNIEPRIKCFDDLKKELENNEHGAWAYFKKGKLFDLYTDIGYDAYDHNRFVEQWNTSKNKQLALIAKLDPVHCILLPEYAGTNQAQD